MRGRRVVAPCLTASPRSAWRRGASIWWLRIGAALLARAPLVRLGLHPADADHPRLMACWRALILRLVATRVLLTKTQAIAAHAARANPSTDNRAAERRASAP
jgi:predicted deacetylase